MTHYYIIHKRSRLKNQLFSICQSFYAGGCIKIRNIDLVGMFPILIHPPQAADILCGCCFHQCPSAETQNFAFPHGKIIILTRCYRMIADIH